MKTQEDATLFYHRQLSERQKEIEKLRGYILNLEGAERKFEGEFSQQITAKDRQISKLIELLNEREDANKKLSEQLEQRMRTEKEYVERLKEAIRKKEETDRSIVQRLTSQLQEKNEEIERLRNVVIAREESEAKHPVIKYSGLKALQKGLEQKTDELKKLEHFYSEKEKYSKKHTTALKAQLEEERHRTEKLRQMLTSRTEELMQLGSVAGLQNEERESSQAAVLGRKLKTKEAELARIERETLEREETQKRTIYQMGMQLAASRKAIDGLQRLAEEKEKLRQKLEQAFNEQLRQKDEEVQSLTTGISQQIKNRPEHYEEIAALKAKLNAKEQAQSEIAEEMARMKEQEAMMRKRLSERQRLFTESEENYNRLLHSLQQQYEARVKELLEKQTRKELELKAELEKARAERNEQEIILQDRQQKIDDALLQFAATSRHLLELKGLGSEELPELSESSYVKKKEEKIRELLQQAESRIRAALRKEQEVSRREALLIKEQEAINQELSVLEKAGIEVGRAKEYVKEKISRYAPESKEESLELPALQQQKILPPEEPEQLFEPEEESELIPHGRLQEAIKEAEEPVQKSKIEKPKTVATAIAKGKIKGAFRQAETKVKTLPKPAGKFGETDKTESRHTAEAQELFSESGGYGEADEVKSIIEIGLQHGDSAESIRESLIASGYSQKSIEEAMRKVKNV